MVKHCGRLCGHRRDRQLIFERELAQIIRDVMQFVYPAHSIPAEFEVSTLLKPVNVKCAEIDTSLYQLHFGQFFRFDISTQLPFFYKSAQKLLVGLCSGLTKTWQREWPMYLSFTPFDPPLIHSGSDDRRVVALVETCAAFTAHGLLETFDGGLVQHNNLEVTQFFKRRWTAVQDEVPVVEDIFSMRMAYPHWERCLHLRRVLDLVIGLTITSSYPIDFLD